jgi:hypothetical protein
MTLEWIPWDGHVLKGDDLDKEEKEDVGKKLIKCSITNIESSIEGSRTYTLNMAGQITCDKKN